MAKIDDLLEIRTEAESRMASIEKATTFLFRNNLSEKTERVAWIRGDGMLIADHNFCGGIPRNDVPEFVAWLKDLYEEAP